MSGPYRSAGGFSPDVEPPREPMAKDQALKVLAKIQEDSLALALVREDIRATEENLAVLRARESNCVKRINECVGLLAEAGNVLRERETNGPA